MLQVHTRWPLYAAAVVLVVHALAYNFVTDDAYISFVYARNFAEHGELTFNLGQYVEGYTNWLWTVILGILMIPGIQPEVSSRVLGLLCAIGTLWLVTRATERVLEKPSPWACLPAVLLACSSGFACWTSGGLETQLFTVLVAGALEALVAGSLRRMAILLALASMTRPEGPMIAVVFGAVHYLRMVLGKRYLPGKAELVCAAWFLALWAPWFLWRFYYYGYPFPNTYYVKASGEWAVPNGASEMRSNGMYYLWTWLRQSGLVWGLPLFGLGAVTAVIDPRRRIYALACLGLALFYVPYAISVGGDFMGLHRFVMPLFVVGAILVSLGVEWLASLMPKPAGIAIAGVVIAAFGVTQIFRTSDALACTGRDGPLDNACRQHNTNDKGIDTPSFLIVYTDDRAKIGEAMASCFTDADFSIVGGAGAQPYYGRMRGIDVFGLVSERVAHEEPRTRARAGHTKFANDNLLLQYDPTFVFSCYSIGPKPDAPKLPCGGFWLAHGYEQVTMHIPDLREQGEYYSFMAKKARHFECPGRVH